MFNNKFTKYTKEEALHAARTSNITWLTAFFEEEQDTGNLACELLQHAAFHGQIQVLQLSTQYSNTFFYARVYDHAARGGQVECLKYLMNVIDGLHAGASSHSWFSVLSNAAEFGQLECMQLAYDNMHNHNLWPNIQEVVAKTAAGGHLECLKFCLDKHFVVDTNTTYCAARDGHLECLQYAIKCGCPVTSNCGLAAIQRGNFQCFRCIYNSSCEIAWKVLFEWLNKQQIKFILNKHDWFVSTILYIQDDTFSQTYPKLYKLCLDHQQALHDKCHLIQTTLNEFCCEDISKSFVRTFLKYWFQ